MLTKVSCECFGAPGYIAGVADGCKGTQALIHPRVLEGNGECAMAAHAVSCDAGIAGVQLREVGCNQGWQLLQGHKTPQAHAKCCHLRAQRTSAFLAYAAAVAAAAAGSSPCHSPAE